MVEFGVRVNSVVGFWGDRRAEIDVDCCGMSWPDRLLGIGMRGWRWKGAGIVC